MTDEAGRPRRRRGPVTVLVLLGAAVAAAVLQAPPVERVNALPEDGPVSIAHGGASGHAPENTLPALELAVEQGAEMLEVDLQLTADDAVVAIHDGSVDRTTDGEGRVRELTLEQVKGLEAGHDFPGADGDYPFVGRGIRVPTLAEVFEAFPDRWILLDVKPESGPGIVGATADVVREHGREDRTIIASFDLDFVREFRDSLPGAPTSMPEGEVRTYYVLQLVGLHRWWQPPGELLQVPTDFDGMRVVTPGFVRAARDREVDVHVWTINDPEEMHRLLNLGVDGIITDYPDRFRGVVETRELAASERADPDLHPGLGTVQGLQDRSWLRSLMEAVTFLGDEEFYVLVFPLVYWSIHRTIGIHLGLLFLLSASLNAVLKLAWRTPRPSFLDPSVELRAESTFGLPSGHAQNAVAVWGLLAAWVRRRWAWVVAIAIIVLLGVSRLQLGAHFPVDTIVGWLVGAVLLSGYLRWRGPVGRWVASRAPRRQLWLAFGASVGLVGLGVLARVAFLAWELPAGWIGVDPAEHPAQLSSVVTPAATLFGFCAGLVFLRGRGGFSSGGTLWQRALRYAVGLVGVLALWWGLGELFPGGEDPVALVFRFLRYAVVGMWVGGVAPIVFVRLGLASPDSPSEAGSDRNVSAPGRYSP